MPPDVILLRIETLLLREWLDAARHLINGDSPIPTESSRTPSFGKLLLSMLEEARDDSAGPADLHGFPSELAFEHSSSHLVDHARNPRLFENQHRAQMESQQVLQQAPPISRNSNLFQVDSKQTPLGTLAVSECDADDQAALLVVGDYQFGSIMQSLLAQMVGPFDVQQHPNRSPMQTGRLQNDEQCRFVAAELQTIPDFAPKHLWKLRNQEWSFATAWCQLHVTYWEYCDVPDFVRSYRTLERQLRQQRFVALTAAFERTSATQVSPIWRWRCVRSLGRTLLYMGRFADAEGCLREAVQIACEEGLSAEDRYHGLILLGAALRVSGQFEEAESWQRKALQTAFDEDLPAEMKCQSLSELADPLRMRGFYTQADVLLRQALALAQAGEISVSVRCKIMTSLANTLRLMRREEEAEDYLRQALMMAQKETIAPLTRFNILQSLGNTLRIKKSYAESESYLRQAVRIASEEELDVLSRSNAFASLGKLLRAQGRLEESEASLRDAVQIASDERLDHQTQCNGLLTLSDVLRRRGKFAEAELRLEAAVEIAGRKGLKSSVHYKILMSLGDVLRLQERYSEAELRLEMAWRIAEEEGLKALIRCKTLVSLGNVLQLQGKCSEAELRLEMAWRIAEEEGLKARICCKTLVSLGGVLQVQGKYSEAELRLEMAWRIAEEEGLDAVIRCMTLVSLGSVLQLQGKYSEAELRLEMAWRIAEEEGLKARIRCKTLVSLGGVLRLQGRYSEAESRLEVARQFAEQEGMNTSMRCDVLVSLGDLLRQQGRYSEAESRLEMARQFAEENCLNAWVRHRILSSLGNVLRVQGRYSEAEPHLEMARQIAEQVGMSPSTRSSDLRSLGELLENEACLRQALMIAQNSEASAITRFNALKSLGKALRDSGNCAEATVHLREALKIAYDEGLPSRPRCQALTSLGEALQDEGNYIEAEDCLKRATRLVNDDALDTLPQLQAVRALGALYSRTQRFSESLPEYRHCRQLLFEFLSGHSNLAGVPNTLRSYEDIFVNGRRMAEEVWRQQSSEGHVLLWEVLAFWDAERCVSIRERLRRQIARRRIVSKDVAAVEWKAGPADWRKLFVTDQLKDPSLAGATIRGLREVSHDRRTEIRQVALLEVWGEVESESPADKIKFCEPIKREELKDQLSTDQTVILGFYTDADDIVVLPIRKDLQTGEPEILFLEADRSRRLFRISGVRQTLQELVAKQTERLRAIRQRFVGKHAGVINEECNLRTNVYEPLYQTLQLDRLLRLITREDESPSTLHLLVIPDGILFQLPLHAAYDETRGQSFLTQVGSLNYALSLRTLELQRKIETADQSSRSQIQTTVFAYPDREQRYGEHLSFAWREVESLVEMWGIDSLRIHGEHEPQMANRSNLRERHGLGNIYYNISHGGKVDDHGIVSHDGRQHDALAYSVMLADGPVSDVRMAIEGYDFNSVRLAHFSSCLLGRLESSGRASELEGLAASLAWLGCRRMSSALWELCDKAGALFGRCLAEALREHAFVERPHPHAFAIAFRDAMLKFQKLDDGHWSHEFYWATYVLYGLP